jgi:hypothetical protein
VTERLAQPCPEPPLTAVVVLLTFAEVTVCVVLNEVED